MSVVYRRHTAERAEFVRSVFEVFSSALKTRRRILVKPNLVSAEPYPATTHPEVLDAVLGILKDMGKEVVVADEPAVDARRSAAFEGPLAEVCRRHGLVLEKLAIDGTVRTRVPRPGGPAYRVFYRAIACDGRISLPVLKVHRLKSIGLTGALKNQFSFLSRAERIACHLGLRDIHRAIVDVNLIAPVDVVLMDAVEVLIGANERRQGGRPAALGTLLAGDDPVALDHLGFSLLAGTGDPKLAGRAAEDIVYIRRAVESKLGSKIYRVLDI